jgi:calcium-dependent protein kinase
MKTFKLSNATGKQRSQLQSEVEVFLCMDHPHITRLYDVYDAQDYLFLVMECMDGGELFDRVMELKRFSERDAADAVWQMLLALMYLHSHGIVHRDLKLENFLYDKKGSNHLKLIDFGFSHMFDPHIKMRASCGTLSYVAPEVLQKSYTSQCDLWSLGVIVFILLAGYMPFFGAETEQTKKISEGKYTLKPERWNNISKDGLDFTRSLLQIDPDKRLTATKAIEHVWIQQRAQNSSNTTIDSDVVDALRQFGQASKFRRCCLEMMAWSLSNDERSQVRQYFLAMDANKHGTITLAELKSVLEEKFKVPDDETKAIFNALDTNNDEEIHYSDFLAAMVSTRIELHDDLLKNAFRKFDTDSSGYITVDNLREVLGDTFEGQDVEKLICEADILQDGRVSYPEFVSYLTGNPLEDHSEAALKVIDTQIDTEPFRNLREKRLSLGISKERKLGGGSCSRGLAACGDARSSCDRRAAPRSGASTPGATVPSASFGGGCSRVCYNNRCCIA